MKSLTLRHLEVDLPILVSESRPLVFDVGANKGQSIELFQRLLPNPIIKAFEPNSTLTQNLLKAYKGEEIVIENIALGPEPGTLPFNIFQNNELSSILDLDRTSSNPFSGTPLQDRVLVQISTLDLYVKEKNITRIDLLKIDTQGYDLDVLRGGTTLLSKQSVETILVEVNFVQLYQGQASFGEIERYLAACGYGLLCFYEIVRVDECISWATACFRKKSLT